MELLFLPLKPPNVSLLGTAWKAAAKDPGNIACTRAVVFSTLTPRPSPFIGKEKVKEQTSQTSKNS